MLKTQILRKEEFATPSASLKLASPQKMPIPKPPPRINVGIQKKQPLSNYQVHKSNQELPPVPKRKDSKLDKALNDFDQIVQDFMSAPSSEKTSKIPKLQKAKTCCVIESRSVYKRTLSAPAGYQSSQMKKKTKSLLDLHQDDKKNNETKSDNVRDVIMKFSILTSTPKKNSTLLKNFEFSENNHNSFLKETTIDCSSVGEENDLSVANQLDDESRKFKEILPHRSVSRSTSTNSDYNEEKKNSISRIPVNTHLRKSFPSTPLGLNKLDQQNGSQFLEGPNPRCNLSSVKVSRI
ncbi:hypothetical protein WA026_019776 [Henosepilachna vigintioctopunctata]|uniref:Exophilin 5 n=1 Tax=Henosepilachna vigintioctopunctata TaxID=420089 RepID=A0AAW1VEJ5_9CUCU